MAVLISIFTCFCLIALWWLVIKSKSFIVDLTVATRSRQHLLTNKSSALLQWIGLDALLEETNKLIDRHNDYADTQMGRLRQLEAILVSIQEAVIIFSKDREIEYANESARKLFRQGEQLKGQRLESVLRSPNLIDYLSKHAKYPDYSLQQLSLEREGKLLWFEVSCASIRETNSRDDVSTLLVLHNITQLKQLEELRREFVANVSHELRTPITIIKGYTETLIEDDAALTVEKRVRFLEKIEKNTQRLHLLVEDLLLLSRLESRPDQIKLSIESLRQLLDEILEDYNPRLHKEKQQMILVFDEQVGKFAFDRFRIQQVFDNLIENVFNYAPDFTEIRLEISYDKETNNVRCTVADDGPGIPEKDLPHIFQRFYRVDKGRSHEGGGTGLGLSITKHIVQQHGGTVYAKSKPGQGTSIHFSLPYVQTILSEKANLKLV
jgi:two-component system, OmpR family, phosphate regulon sensor histidine kinase PhoR